MLNASGGVLSPAGRTQEDADTREQTSSGKLEEGGSRDEGLSEDAKQQEKERRDERWMRAKKGKENLISCWNKLSFITLMEKNREGERERSWKRL